jgi:tetratricopeptide (TPR) repeat protein
MRRIALTLLASLALAACTAHEKSGDRAAATGDWKSAEREYAQALRDEPQNPERRQKWTTARDQAITSAMSHARTCAISQDWECAFGEADYAQALDTGNAEIAAFRVDAARNVGAQRVRAARDAGGRRDYAAAFDLLSRARQVTPDPAVHAEAARVQPAIVQMAVQEAQRYQKAQQFAEAIQTLTAVAKVDGSVRPLLDQIRADQERVLEAQYERVAREGDALLRDRRFSEAADRYAAAQKVKPGGRAEPLARYARALANADAAVLAKDWARAGAAFEEAVKSGADHSGYAAAELERVRLRPYAVRLDSVLVKPIRTDGQPWAGARSRTFERIVGLIASAALDPRNGPAGQLSMQLYEALPDENRPNLVASIELPDGRRFATPPRTAVFTRLDGTVVVATNSFDERALTVRVVHQDVAGPVDVGAVTFRLADLVAKKALVLGDRAVVELRVSAEPSPQRDGSLSGLTLINPPVATPGGPPTAPPPRTMPASTPPATPTAPATPWRRRP